jgi:SWI/SNF-related matrix-associated actin-dependent regulator of chromatin subfamily A member 5
MIQHGAEKIINSSTSMMVDDDIDEIIRKGEDRTKELNSKYAGLDLDALNNFRSESLINQWEGEDFAAKRRNMIWIEPAKRERKGNYSIDQYYRDNMKVTASKPDKPKVPRPPKQVHINDFQFFPPRLAELQNRESDAHLKAQNYVVPLRTELEEGETTEDAENERAEEQARIDNSEPLTEEEVSEKEQLAEDGFGDWQRRHFHAFIKAMERYGRDQMDLVVKEVADKEEDDVRAYAKVFFERYNEIKGECYTLELG